MPSERVRPQSMAATLAVLDERGLVQRRPDPNDGRRQLISLTDERREFFSYKQHAGDEWLTRSLDERLSEEDPQAHSPRP
ncbi:MarR family winged helix-turn-helix transcriptional regulator [Rhodococcus xishaensis]|uniref:Uncharacterized protein n=1 Tax=Rhodococcus xishaensis TaxID=2487364 RepID=A0A3S3CME9_9NOCA|nr:winged helix DNA-binding protein [Rhodococcus xishaensis]RVW01068.1 hypothetical protein EGT50_12385 [Rhodococcus xishaensis]